MAYYDADMDVEHDVDRMDSEYTIYVNNLPVELNEDAIRDIFGQYGIITGMFHPRNATWTFITYGSYREAELAVRELHEKKPLFLKVAFTKEKREFTKEESNEKQVMNITNSSSPINSDMRYQNMGRGQSTGVIRKHVMPRITIPSNYADYESLPSPNVCEIDHYMHTNKLWTRGMITVTPDGKRHVSLGRGYTLYEFPEPYPKLEECISKVYEQRNNGLYEYSEDKFKNEVHNCSVCSIRTIKHCQKCRTYYCSKACQLRDWPRHQAECERIPPLVEEINDISSLQINQDVNQIKNTSMLNINKMTKSGDVKLRRPNTLNTMQTENSSNMINVNKCNTETHKSVNNTQDRHVSAQHDNDINVSQTKMTEQPVISAINTKESSQQLRLRGYNNTNECQSRQNNGYSTSSSNNQNYSCNYQNNSKQSPKERYDNNSSTRDRIYNNDKDHPQRYGFQNDKGSANYNDRDINKQGNASNNTSVNNDFYRDTHLSKTKFIIVEIIIPLDNDEYWVYKLEDTDARMNLMVTLQDVAKKSRNVQPIIGEIYGVMYETFWHRAMITSLNPIKVHFIDYGNDEILGKNSEIKDIGDLIKSPKFARKIRLTEGTNDKYRNLQEGDKLSVRMLFINSEKTIIVEVEEEQSIAKNLSSHTTESVSNNAEKKSVLQKNSEVSPNKYTNADINIIPDILDTLANFLTQQNVSEIQINGFIQMYKSSQKNVYAATLVPTVPENFGTQVNMIIDDIQDDCSKIQISADYKPKAEELICGKWNESWYRGYISTPSTFSASIFSIDEARILFSVDKIVPCPKRYSNICAFGVICETNSDIELQEQTAFDFTAIINEKNSKQKSLKIEITVNSEVIQAVVRSWKSPNLFELKNGSKICLTSYRNHYYMFARSLEETEVEYYNEIMQSVAKCAQRAPYLTKPPLDKEVVIAPFEDGNSYRAMVLKAENNKAQIVYIDFGNIAEIDIKDLKIISKCLSQERRCATKVILKDVPRDVPMNREVDMYLRHLSGTEVPLVCTFESSSEDGVRLMISDTGECVNDTINQLLIPGWKKDDEDNTCYMLKDIKIASLGRVGDIVDAVVLFIREDDQTTYMMGPCDHELMTHVFEIIPAMLKEYCEKMEYYIPRAEELCLALYEGAWYRAACLNPKESHTTSPSSQILFIDYGNIELVEHKDIRLMPKDFIVPQAIANLCTVVNLAPVDSNGKYSKAVQKKLEELVQLNSKVKIKIVECFENGDYKIELPEVRAALIQHDDIFFARHISVVH